MKNDFIYWTNGIEALEGMTDLRLSPIYRSGNTPPFERSSEFCTVVVKSRHDYPSCELGVPSLNLIQGVGIREPGAAKTLTAGTEATGEY